MTRAWPTPATTGDKGPFIIRHRLWLSPAEVITYVILSIAFREKSVATTTKIIAIGNSAGIILPKEHWRT